VTIWHIIRIILVVLFFVSGFFNFDDGLKNPPLAIQIFFIIAPIFFFPLALLIVIGVQYINPLQYKRWTLPSMDSNFLSLMDPVHFFHASVYFSASAGLGVIIGALFRDSLNPMEGLKYLSSSLGIFLGIKLCIKVYYKKFLEPQPIMSSRKNSIINKIAKSIGMLMVFIAVIAILTGSFSLIKTFNFISKAVKTYGIIAELHRSDDVSGVTYRPVFSFMDTSGNQYNVYSSLGDDPPKYKVGDKVPVVYDPEQPQKAQIDSFLDLYGLPLAMVIIAVINLAVGLFLIFVIGNYLPKFVIKQCQ